MALDLRFSVNFELDNKYSTRYVVLRPNAFELKSLLPVNTFPENEKHRLVLLTTLLQVREELTKNCTKTDR